MILLFVYLLLGILILAFHPKLRGILLSTLDRGEDAAFWEGAVIFTAALGFFLVLWPLALVVRGINSGREDHRLAEMKEHVASLGMKPGVSDGILMTYRGVIEKQFRNVAKERGERIPDVTMREIVLYYISHWVAANEHTMGMAMPFLINGGADIYREGGLEALLKEIREEKTFFPLKNHATGSSS